MNPKKLEQIRAKIDRIDNQLIVLFNKRAILAQDTAIIKRSEDKDSSLYRSDREAMILRSIVKRNSGPLPNKDVVYLFRELMSSCLRLEEPIKVGYLGPEGTFTQEATMQHFGMGVSCYPLTLIHDIFQELQNNQIDFGVVPIENSSEGVIHNTLDSLLNSDVYICSEVELNVHQNLLVSKQTVPEKISQIYSHPMSFAQCRKWLDRHFPNIKKIPVSSNAEAAIKIKSEWHSAAIAGKLAAEMYQLDVLHSNIEDKKGNSTRFLVLGNVETQTNTTGADKTSIIVTVPDQAGILFDILRPFKSNGINLSRIETRPSRQKVWTYSFFIDFEGHLQDENVRQVFSDLSQLNIQLKNLGSYPQAQ